MQTLADSDIDYGPYRLYDDGRLRCGDGTIEQLPLRLKQPLAMLMAARGRTVTKDQLIEKCWSRGETSDQNLARAIADLRKLFRRHGDDPVKTVYSIGYRLEVTDPFGSSKGEPARDAQFRKAELLYAEARHRIHARRSGSLDVAERLLRDAETMHDSSGNWLAIAETHFQRMQLGYAAVEASWAQARPALERALTGDPAASLSMMALGLCWAEWDFTTAEALLARARAINPAGYAVNECAAYREMMIGNNDLAIEDFRRAIEANPVALAPRAFLSLTLSMMGRTGDALAEADEMIRIDQESPISLGFRALVETRSGNPELSVAPARQSVASLPDSPHAAAILAYALSASGQSAEARTLLERPPLNDAPFGTASSFACWAWLSLDEPRRALATLQICAERRCPQLPFVLRDPALASITNEPAYRHTFNSVFGAKARA